MMRLQTSTSRKARFLSVAAALVVGAALAVMHDLDASGHGDSAHSKMFSGRKAETIQLGASTISLILRSTATLATM